MIRAVLDTNVVVSSVIDPDSTPGRLIAHWKHGDFEICMSQELFEEIEDVLGRSYMAKYLKMSKAEVQGFLQALTKSSMFYSGSLALQAIVQNDPDDDVVLATALATGADVIVSGDRHLLDLASYGKIGIITPREFLDLLEPAPPQ